MSHPLNTLLGGEEIDVSFRDGRGERVLVRELSVRELTRDLRVIDDEAAFIELACKKPEGWADKLVPSSHDALAEKAWAVNRPTLERWMERRARRLGDVRLPTPPLSSASASTPPSPSA